MIPEIFLICALALPVQMQSDRYRKLRQFMLDHSEYQFHMTEDINDEAGWKYTGFTYENLKVYVRRSA